MTAEQEALVSRTVEVLGSLPGLCSPHGSITIIPTVLYLVTGVLKDVARSDCATPASLSSAMVSIEICEQLNGEKSENRNFILIVATCVTHNLATTYYAYIHFSNSKVSLLCNLGAKTAMVCQERYLARKVL